MAKTTALLSYMVAHPPHVFAREMLAALFWGQMTPARARNNLSVSLSVIRQTLEQPTGCSLLQATKHSVALNREGFSADVLEFEKALQDAELASDATERYALLTRAAELYAGDFLPGHYEPWVVERAVVLQGQCVRVLGQLVRLELARGDSHRARQWLTKMVSINPLDEDAAAQLMELYLQAKQETAAAQLGAAWLGQYRELTGEPPPARVRALWQEAQRRLSGGLLTATPPRLHASPLTTPLPALPRTRLIGRERELEQLSQLLAEPTYPCVTITGLGGVGKTRLALELAHLLRAQKAFPVHWVSLLPIREADQLITHLTQSLGLAAGSDPLDALLRYCTLHSPLVFLDNFEHLLPEGAIVVAKLLRAVPELRVCVTSRLPLRIEGETVFALTPLACTDSPDCPALRLLVERAQQTNPRLELTEQDFASLRVICRRLDGVPLALELAAARLDTLTPAQMLGQINERLRWLRVRRRDLEPRHSTMQGVLATTVALLPAFARRLLAQLSLLPEEWTEEQAQAVSAFPQERLEEALTLLREASLIVQASNSTPRYRMLETVREYAQTLLTDPARIAAEKRLCRWVLRVAQRHAPEAHTNRLSQWLKFWDEIRFLLLRALDLLEQQGKLHEAVCLIRATERYWYLRPLHEDALRRLQRWLDSGRLSEYDAIEARLVQVRLLVETGQFQRAQPVAAALRQVDRRDPRRGKALFWVVRVAMALHDAPTLTRYWRQLRKRFPCPSNPELHFSIHNILPYIEQVDDIVAWREAEVAFARQVGDPLMLGFALGALIEPLMFFGEFTRALRLSGEVHRLYTQLEDALHLHRVHHTQALCYLHLGALEPMQQVLDACSEQEQLLGLSPYYTRWLQVCLWREQGDYGRAVELALSEATLQEIEQNWLAAAEMLDQAALCFYAQGDLDTALRYCTEARRLAERGVPQGRTLPPSPCYLYLQACAGSPEALRGLEARLHEWRTHNLRPLQATALLCLSEGYALQGNLERARACLQEAVELNQAMGRRLALQKCQNLARKLGSNYGAVI